MEYTMGNILYYGKHSSKHLLSQIFYKKFYPDLIWINCSMAVVSSEHGCLFGNDVFPSNIRRRKNKQTKPGY